MEVSRKLSLAENQVSTAEVSAEIPKEFPRGFNEEPRSLEGGQLIDTLVTLTGLPEPVAHDELDQILALTGRDGVRADLTLDELRQALLLYLESFQPEPVPGEEFDAGFDA